MSAIDSTPKPNINSEQEKKSLEKLTKQIAKGGGIVFLGNFGGKLLKFLFQIFLTRVLGANSYGLYALGYSVLGISATFSQMGLQNGVVRFGSVYTGEKEKGRLKGTIIVSLLSSFFAGFILALFLYIFSRSISISIFHEPELTSVIKVFAFSLPFYTFITVTAFTFRIFRRMQYDVGLRLILHPILLIIYTGISFFLGYRLLGVIYGFLISSILSAAIGFYLLWRIFPDLISGLKPQFEIKKLLCFSFTVLLIGFSSIIIFQMDRIMLGILSETEDVGIYTAAAVMAGQATIFLHSSNAIFSPIISNLYNRGKITQLNSLFKTTTKWIFTLTFPFVLIFILFSKQIMSIYGVEFRVGWLVLIVLGLAQLVNAIVGSSGFILLMTGYQKLELTNNLILGGLNIVLNLLLIPILGILGAAIATGTSIVLVNIVRLIEVYFFHRIHPYKWVYWKPLIAGLTASFSLKAISSIVGWQGITWIFGFLLFIILYILILILIGFDQEDRLIIRVIANKLPPKHG